jgi:hypothetical protein
MTLDETLRTLLIEFQNALAARYKANACNAPCDSQQLDQGKQDRIEAWHHVKELLGVGHDNDKGGTDIECCKRRSIHSEVSSQHRWMGAAYSKQRGRSPCLKS